MAAAQAAAATTTTTIQLRPPGSRSIASEALARCVVHTKRSAQLVRLLFLHNPSFTTSSATVAAQLQKLLPACSVAYTPPSSDAAAATAKPARHLTVRSAEFGRWNHPLAKQLAAAKHATDVHQLLRATFVAPPLPQPPPHVRALLDACRCARWADARRRPVIVNWQGDAALHRLFLLQGVLAPHTTPSAARAPSAAQEVPQPPTSVLVVAADEAGVNAWALSVQSSATLFASGLPDTRVTIATPQQLASLARSCRGSGSSGSGSSGSGSRGGRGGSGRRRRRRSSRSTSVSDLEFQVALVDQAAHARWDMARLARARNVIHACPSVLLLVVDPWLLTPHTLPRVLRWMGERVTRTSRSTMVWRGAVVRGTDWPRALLSTAFRDVLFAWTPRTDWARGVQLGHIQQVTHQHVPTCLSVAQAWEYLLAGGAEHPHLPAPAAPPPTPPPPSPSPSSSSSSKQRRDARPRALARPLALPLPLAPPSRGTATLTRLSALCNATDRHARVNPKWTWLSAQLKDTKLRAQLLPLVVLAEGTGETGTHMIARALKTSPSLAKLRVRAPHGGGDLVADVAAFNEGIADVLVLTTAAVERTHVKLARAVVFWEPCHSAAAESRALIGCCPHPPAPLSIHTLVAHFPKRQLRQCARHPMPQTDAWLQQQARKQWPKATARLAACTASPTWPRNVLWKALGGATAQERRVSRVQQEVLTWGPVATHIAAMRAPLRAAATLHTRREASWTVTERAHERYATPSQGPPLPVRMRKAPILSHHTTDTAAWKSLVVKLKRKTADTWRPWCPRGTTMAVWSRRITPLVLQLVQRESRRGWSLDQLEADTSLMPQLAVALGVPPSQHAPQTRDHGGSGGSQVDATATATARSRMGATEGTRNGGGSSRCGSTGRGRGNGRRKGKGKGQRERAGEGINSGRDRHSVIGASASAKDSARDSARDSDSNSDSDSDSDSASASASASANDSASDSASSSDGDYYRRSRRRHGHRTTDTNSASGASTADSRTTTGGGLSGSSSGSSGGP